MDYEVYVVKCWWKILLYLSIYNEFWIHMWIYWLFLFSKCNLYPGLTTCNHINEPWLLAELNFQTYSV